MRKYQRIEFRRRFGQRLKALRERKKLSKTDVAAALGCTVQNICGIEYGKWGTGTSNLATLARLFEMTVDELLKEEPEHAA